MPGEKFSSYSGLKEKIATYDKSTNIQLNHSDSKTLEAARKRVPRKVEKAKKDLVCYYISTYLVYLVEISTNERAGSGKRPQQR